MDFLLYKNAPLWNALWRNGKMSMNRLATGGVFRERNTLFLAWNCFALPKLGRGFCKSTIDGAKINKN